MVSLVKFSIEAPPSTEFGIDSNGPSTHGPSDGSDMNSLMKTLD